MSLSIDPTRSTIDIFHRGKFALLQPIKGHRSGIDAMILAASLPQNFIGHCADLGAGAGAAGMAVAARCEATHVSLFERDKEMLDYARASQELPDNAHFAERITVFEADVVARGAARDAAGLLANSFDAVIFNPPFNNAADRATPDKQRADAHVIEADMFDAWLRTASGILKPNGMVALIARPENLIDILTAASSRFGSIEIKPIHPRPQTDAIRIVVRGIKGSRARTKLVPAHILHGKAGNMFLPFAESVNNGEAALFND